MVMHFTIFNGVNSDGTGMHDYLQIACWNKQNFTNTSTFI